MLPAGKLVKPSPEPTYDVAVTFPDLSTLYLVVLFTCKSNNKLLLLLKLSVMFVLKWVKVALALFHVCVK